MELTGVTGAPYKHPEVRKKMPAPHSRDRIDLDGGTRQKRSWKDTSVLKVVGGDVIAGFGRVESAVEFMPTFDQESGPLFNWRVRIFNVEGAWKDFGGHERVFAFSKDEAQ